MMQTSIAFQINLAKRVLCESRDELDEIRRLLATRKRERVRQEIKCQLAATRFEKALVKYADVYRKGGFNPDQPRVLAGSREGGRWTSDTSDASGSRESDSPVRLADASDVLPSTVMSDATPDPIIPGARYAQTPVNFDTSALTGISTVDDTTKRLAITLARVKDAVEYTPGLGPQRYGTRVHTEFAATVKAQRLRGIAPSDVETTLAAPTPAQKEA
jgi:hypothetical protein